MRVFEFIRSSLDRGLEKNFERTSTQYLRRKGSGGLFFYVKCLTDERRGELIFTLW